MNNALLKLQSLSASAMIIAQSHLGQYSRTLSYEAIIVCFLIFGAILMTLTLGRSRMVMLIVSLYATGFIYRTIASKYFFATLVRDIPSTLAASLIFVALYVLLSFLFSAIFKNSKLTSKDFGFFSIIVLAILYTAFLASSILPLLPKEVVGVIPFQIFSYFGTEKAQVVWAFLPIIGLFLMSVGKKRRRRN